MSTIGHNTEISRALGKPAEIRRHIEYVLDVICGPGALTEIRALGVRPRGGGRYVKAAAGYFSDHGKAAEEAARLDGHSRGIYFTVNELHPALQARYNNRVELNAENITSDVDIVSRRWLLVDVDPVRRPGISSSDEEKAAAEQRGFDVQAYLTREHGWPEPVWADSGNGYHLLYRITEPNDDATRDVLQRILRALDQIYSDEAVSIDASNFNAARITKLYGTTARKGDSTVDRPHRRSHLVSVPDHIEPVLREQLEAVAREYMEPSRDVPPTATTPTTPASTRHDFDLEAWFRDHVPGEPRRIQRAGSRTVYALHACPFDASHGIDARVIQGDGGMITWACFHDSCRHTWSEYRAMYDEEYRDRNKSPQPSAGEKNPRSNGGSNGERNEIYRAHADHLIDIHHIKTFSDDGSMWYYEDGIYHAGAEYIVESYCGLELNQGPTFAREVMFRVKASTMTPRSVINADPHLVHLDNCVLDTRTLETSPHSPDIVSLTKHPVAWDPEASCPRFVEFLDHIMGGDVQLINIIQEMFGYTLYPDYQYHKMFILHGDGANGKGVLLDLLGAMLGGENVAHVSPSDVSSGYQSLYFLARLQGMAANIVSDMDSREVVNTGTTKSLVGNDRIMARHPYGRAFSFVNRAKFILSMNKPPKLADDSYGLRRRLLPIPFLVQVEEGQEISDYIRPLVEELPGILNWSIEGLRRLLDRDRFDVPRGADRTYEQYELLTNSPEGFARLCVILPSEDPDADDFSYSPLYYPKDRIYEAYLRFCRGYGVTSPHTKNHLMRALRLTTGGAMRVMKPRIGDRIDGEHRRVPCISGVLLHDPITDRDIYPEHIDEFLSGEEK